MTIKEQTEAILKVSHKARNSDRYLEAVYIKKYMRSKGIEVSEQVMEAFLDMPDLQSVTRERRRFQEAGLYRADKEVEERRFEKFQEETSTAPAQAEELLKQQGYKILPFGQ